MFLYQPEQGYRYNSDSMFLYDFTSRFSPKGMLLDIGCGVGIISMLLSRDFNVKTTIVDKQKSMLEYASHNFTINDMIAEKYLGDIATFMPDKRFDFIVSNPPFYASSVTQSENEHLNISRYNHHMPIETLISSAKMLLAPRGYFIFCYDAKQIDTILWQLKESKINPEVIRFVHSKIDKEAKLVMIASRAGSKAMTKIMPPLVVMDKYNNYRDDAQGIFDRADTHSIKADF